MHSVFPNVLPMKLTEIIFRDAIIDQNCYNLQDIDYKKLAFVMGFLTHIGTDQSKLEAELGKYLEESLTIKSFMLGVDYPGEVFEKVVHDSEKAT